VRRRVRERRWRHLWHAAMLILITKVHCSKASTNKAAHARSDTRIACLVHVCTTHCKHCDVAMFLMQHPLP